MMIIIIIIIGINMDIIESLSLSSSSNEETIQNNYITAPYTLLSFYYLAIPIISRPTQEITTFTHFVCECFI